MLKKKKKTLLERGRTLYLCYGILKRPVYAVLLNIEQHSTYILEYYRIR